MSSQKKNTLLQKIQENTLHTEGKKLVVACSGGADSMVLLDLLRTGKIPSSALVVAHVHHGLRKSADRDEKIVHDYCSLHKLQFEVHHVDVKKEAKKTKTTIEECARDIRREWLEKIRKKHHADLIATAHHADDQAETLLYRITKGTGITGLVGIEEKTGYYIRPLIGLTKREILQYAEKNSLPYGHDETNDDTSIPRNLLRHEVMGKLQTINPEVTSALTRLSHSARELKISFDAFFQEVMQEKSFSLDWYHELPL